jgi:hypothetical protein
VDGALELDEADEFAGDAVAVAGASVFGEVDDSDFEDSDFGESDFDASDFEPRLSFL